MRGIAFMPPHERIAQAFVESGQCAAVHGHVRTPALPAHAQQGKARTRVANRSRACRREPHAQLMQMRTLPREPLSRRHETSRKPVELLRTTLHHAAEAARECGVPMVEIA